jgi:hypothetical protein
VTNLKGKNIPLMFILMATKNEKGYLKICDYIITKVPRFNPMAIILDFEMAPRKALQKKFSGIYLYGRLFDFCQNVWQ